MTKRKASTALDPSNESNANSLKIIATDNNVGNLDTCNSNNSNSTVNSVGINHQNITPINSSSLGNTDNKRQIQHQETSNNQNDNSVGSEGSANNSQSTNQSKGKKERADNWSSAEIQILHEGIESRREIFYGPPSQATKKNRESAWEAITREVNAVSTTPRSLSQVMKKFKNEKCRAKRKFTDSDKDGHINNDANNGSHSNNLSCNNNNTNSSNQTSSTITAGARTVTNDASSTINLTAQNQTNNNQQPQASHHMTNSDPLSTPQSSMNIVKLAPQNVAKTMIDLPGHVQHIQMPNDDMVLIVPPDMDSLLNGVNIVSDVNGHHHFQKCSGNGTISNQSHNQHHQLPLQTLNTGQTLVNGTMSNGMTRAPFCILNQVDCTSSGNEASSTDHHLAQGVVSQTAFTTNHIGINSQNLTHHRGAIIDQNQVQPTHHHQLHQHQQQQHHQQPQHQPHPSHTLANSHNQHHLPPSHLATTTSVSNASGVGIESQLKNLLFNLLLKDGQQASTVSMLQSSNQNNKHKSDMLAIIASSLTKIESHLSKISKVASALTTCNMHINSMVDNSERMSSSQGSAGIVNISSSDGNNNNVDMSTTVQTSRQDDER